MHGFYNKLLFCLFFSIFAFVKCNNFVQTFCKVLKALEYFEKLYVSKSQSLTNTNMNNIRKIFDSEYKYEYYSWGMFTNIFKYLLLSGYKPVQDKVIHIIIFCLKGIKQKQRLTILPVPTISFHKAKTALELTMNIWVLPPLLLFSPIIISCWEQIPNIFLVSKKPRRVKTEIFQRNWIFIYVVFNFSLYTRMTEVEMKDGKGQVVFLRKESKEEKGRVTVLRKEMKEEKEPVAVLREELGHDCDSVWLCDKNIKFNKT